MLFSASAACQRTSSLPPFRAALRPVIFGGVLSIQNGLLSMRAVRASAGGLPGASLAVTRKRYSPSGNAVESHETYFSLTLSLSIFHSVSFAPLISTANTSGSPFGSDAAQRAPIQPLAYCIAGVRSLPAPVDAAARLPIGGSESVGVTVTIGVTAGGNLKLAGVDSMSSMRGSMFFGRYARSTESSCGDFAPSPVSVALHCTKRAAGEAARPPFALTMAADHELQFFCG